MGCLSKLTHKFIAEKFNFWGLAVRYLAAGHVQKIAIWPEVSQQNWGCVSSQKRPVPVHAKRYRFGWKAAPSGRGVRRAHTMTDFHLFASGPRPVAPFSHAVESDGWVLLTGQMPTDPQAPDAPLPEGIVAQTDRVMQNLALILAEMGLSLADVVQCRAYLTEFERDYAAFNETYQAYFDPACRPARTTVGVTALAVGALVEVDCVARRP